MLRLACLLLVLCAVRITLGKRTLDRCGLAREMSKQGVPKEELARWTCIAEHESSYRTWIVGPPNTDGSNDYGIFQINDRYWCLPANGKHSSNGCHINCKALLTDEINNSVRCAHQIKREQGWAAWSVYNRYCSGSLPSIDDCFKGLKEITEEELNEADYETYLYNAWQYGTY